MQSLVICALLLLLSTVALAQPAITLDTYNQAEAIRPSGSKGGLVSGVDQIVLRATVNRNGEPPTKFNDDGVSIQLTANPSDAIPLWIPQDDCVPNLAQCSSSQSGCYCADHVSGNFSLVFTLNASLSFEGGSIRVGWKDVTTGPFVDPEFGTAVSYPTTICEALNATYDTGQGPQTLSATVNNTVDYSRSLTELKYCANGLKSPDFVRISKDSLVIIEKTEICISVDPSTNTDITYGTQLTLSFEESDTAGCGRSGSYSFLFSGEESDKDDDCGSIPCWLLAIIIIIIIIAIIFFVCCVCFGFLCCKHCNKKCRERDEEDCYFFCCCVCAPKDEEKRRYREYYDNKSYKCLKGFFCCLGPSPKQLADLERQLKELNETIETNSSENGQERLATLQREIIEIKTQLAKLEDANETNSSENGQERLATLQREIIKIETQQAKLKDANGTQGTKNEKQKPNCYFFCCCVCAPKDEEKSDKQAQQNSQNQASETQGSRKGEKPNEGTTAL